MITGFVLAGGQSRRMGCDKAWLPVGTQTLIERVIERLRPYVGRVVVIGNAHNTPLLRALAVDGVLTDCVEGYGPLMGMYTGLMHSTTALNLFVSCDMPQLAPWLFETLLAAPSPEADIVALQLADGRLQPLPVLCHTRAAQAVGRLLNQRRLALHALAALPGTRLRPMDVEGTHRALANVNTQADYEKYR